MAKEAEEESLCGSAVVYQIPTKVAWLDIDPHLIEQHGYVSEEVAERMASGVLSKTPHATLAASITGDLGPNADPSTDGTAWIAILTRDQRRMTKFVDLPSAVPDNQSTEMTLRRYRQEVAVQLMLTAILRFLHSA